MELGESVSGQQSSNHAEISQDLTTTFFILLAIIFPSVTGIMTGINIVDMYPLHAFYSIYNYRC